MKHIIFYDVIESAIILSLGDLWHDVTHYNPMTKWLCLFEVVAIMKYWFLVREGTTTVSEGKPQGAE